VGASPVSTAIRGRYGDLVSVRISTDVRQLEDLLEVLANASFPVNPQLFHRPLDVLVEFPAWTGQVAQLKAHLAAAGFDRSVKVCSPLDPL